MSAERGGRPGLTDYLGRSRVETGGSLSVIRDLGKFSQERRQKGYQGPLSEFFKAGSLPSTDPATIEIILGDRRFTSKVSFSASNEAGEEFLRISFESIKPMTGEKVILNLTPKRLEIRRVEEQGEQPPREATVFSWNIYSGVSLRGIKDRLLATQPTDPSIEGFKEISDWVAYSALVRLDLRRIPELQGEPMRVEPIFLAGREIAKIIGQNLEVLPQEQRS